MVDRRVDPEAPVERLRFVAGFVALQPVRFELRWRIGIETAEVRTTGAVTGGVAQIACGAFTEVVARIREIREHALR